MDSETPNSNDKYLCGTTRLGRLRVFVMLAFVVVSCSGAKTPITLEQQIEIIRAKYKAAKPVSSDAQEAKPTIPQLYITVSRLGINTDIWMARGILSSILYLHGP